MKYSYFWFICCLLTPGLKSQTPTVSPVPFVWKVSLFTADEICTKGAAGIQLPPDTLPIFVQWSNGNSNTASINNLNAGNYSVMLKRANKDTTLNFTIAKIMCPVFISNHFTPNDDGYNDTWQISNVASYPNFEVYVFNKWGQQVHKQANTFTPWDGTSLGIKVPDGAYYYVFYFDKDKKNDLLKGDITLLR